MLSERVRWSRSPEGLAASCAKRWPSAAAQDFGRSHRNLDRTLLADREGHPDAVSKACSTGESTATLFSVIFDCAGHALYLAAGAPADHAYQKFAW